MLKFSGYPRLNSGQSVEHATLGRARKGAQPNGHPSVSQRSPGSVASSIAERRSGIWSRTLHHRASCERRTSSLQPRKRPTLQERERALARPAPRAYPASKRKGGGGVRGTTTLRQTCRRQKPSAQYAFKISMILEDLQFTLRIAFRCVLHRCESQDIRC